MTTMMAEEGKYLFFGMGVVGAPGHGEGFM